MAILIIMGKNSLNNMSDLKILNGRISRDR